MFFQNFSVRIIGGTELPDGYVRIHHGQPYSIVLRNGRNARCDAAVQIDGKPIGTFRIPMYTSIELERPPNDTGRFTFYRLGSPESIQANLTDDTSLGLVSVTFTPELIRDPRPLSPSITGTVTSKGIMPSIVWPATTGSFSTGTRATASFSSTAGGQSAAPGGTGLSGHSNQYYVTADLITYDYAQQATINLRLVATDDDTPRPLTTNTTPIPPRI